IIGTFRFRGFPRPQTLGEVLLQRPHAVSLIALARSLRFVQLLGPSVLRDIEISVGSDSDRRAVSFDPELSEGDFRREASTDAICIDHSMRSTRKGNLQERAILTANQRVDS